MTLYRPSDGHPAIDPLAACTTPPAPPAPQREAPPAARVAAHGRSQLTAPRLVLVCDPSLQDSRYLPWQLYHCLSSLVAGDFATGLRQYGAGPGSYAGYASPVVPAGKVSTSQLADWLDATVDAGQIPSVGPETLMLLFPGLATQLGEPGFQYGVDFCAYHSVTPKGRAYGVQPYPIDAAGGPLPAGTCGQRLGLSDLDCLTMTASHELAEAMTDTIPGQGEDGPEGEIDDFAPCLWSPVSVRFQGWQYRVQAYWREDTQHCWTPGAADEAVPVAPAAGVSR